MIGPAIAGVTQLVEQMINGEEIDLPTVTFMPEGKRNLVTGEAV